MLSGNIVDQAALHGVLTKVRDLGLPLVAVRSAGPHRRRSRHPYVNDRVQGGKNAG